MYILETGRDIKVIYIYIYIYIYTYIHTYHLIVVCIDGKRYITGNERQQDTEISVNVISIATLTVWAFKELTPHVGFV
jgi:hypothetical protein